MNLIVRNVNPATAHILAILASQRKESRSEYIRDHLELIADSALLFWEREGYMRDMTARLRKQRAFEELDESKPSEG